MFNINSSVIIQIKYDYVRLNFTKQDDVLCYILYKQ